MVNQVSPNPNLKMNDNQTAMQNLKQYGGYIISAIVLVLAGYFGWTYYQNHGGRLDTASAQAFAAVQNRSDAITTLSQTDNPTSDQQKQLASDTASLQSDITSFVKNHPNNVYTWQALMLQAKHQADNEDFKAVVATLKQATQLSLNDEGLTAIATLRYAQALLANGQADDAKAALVTTLPAAFDASKNELLGDIASTKNDKKAAANYYQQAWTQIETRNKTQSIKEDRAALRIKLEGLGISTAVPDLDGGLVAKPAAKTGEIETDATPQAAVSAPALTKNENSPPVTKANATINSQQKTVIAEDKTDADDSPTPRAVKATKDANATDDISTHKDIKVSKATKSHAKADSNDAAADDE